MPYTLKSNRAKFKDANGNYKEFDLISENSTASQIAAIEVKGAETLASIPADYTALSDSVDDLKSAFNDSVALMSDGVFDEIYGLGSFLTSAHKFVKTSPFAFCVTLSTGNIDKILVFTENMRFQYYDESGSWVGGVDKSKFLDLRAINAKYLQISYNARSWGSTYTEDDMISIASDMAIVDAKFDCVIIPEAIPCYVDSSLNFVYTNVHQGNWVTHIIHMNKYDVLEYDVKYTSPTYPFICSMQNGAPTTKLVESSSYAAQHGYISASEDMDICVCSATYANSTRLDAPVFKLNSTRTVNKYTGKVMSFIGDSYVANNEWPVNYTWHYKLCNKWGAKYNNYGINGGGIIATRGDRTPVAERLDTIDPNSDFIMVIGGENDANVSYDIDDFKTGFNTMIGTMLSQFPRAEIVVMCPWGYGASYREYIKPYADAMRDVCNTRGVKFFDAAKNYVDSSSEISRNRFYQSSSDSSHLNNTGHDRFALMIDKFLAG